MPLSVCSSSSSSSDSESDFSDQSPRHQQRNTEQLVKYFREAQTRARPFPGARPWQKLDNALIDARLALLEVSWSALLKALKSIEDGLQQTQFGSKLEWRRPVLYRLKEDIARLVPVAVLKKRSLPPVEAKSLSIIKQKLGKESDTSRFWSIDLSNQKPIFDNDLSPGDRIVLDCFELALIVLASGGSKSILKLSNLNLQELPSLMRGIPALQRWYASFGPPETGIDVFDALDLRDNNLSTLPIWLLDAVPRIKRIFLTGNFLLVLPPVITALQDLELLDTDQPSRSPIPNNEVLVSRARELVNAKRNTGPYIPPLVLICTEVLRQAGYDAYSNDVPYLQRYWSMERYVCASCKQHIYSEDPGYLSGRLRERYTHFDPPVTQLTASGQLPRATYRTSHVVSGPEWTFCAPCLILHCAETTTEAVEKCMCMACSASRKM